MRYYSKRPREVDIFAFKMPKPRTVKNREACLDGCRTLDILWDPTSPCWKGSLRGVWNVWLWNKCPEKELWHHCLPVAPSIPRCLGTTWPDEYQEVLQRKTRANTSPRSWFGKDLSDLGKNKPEEPYRDPTCPPTPHYFL